jgi:hypothetical protein
MNPKLRLPSISAIPSCVQLKKSKQFSHVKRHIGKVGYRKIEFKKSDSMLEPFPLSDYA